MKASDDEHRVRLLELAAKRGEKDLAGRCRAALALRGSLSDKDAEELRAAVSRLRESWRLPPLTTDASLAQNQTPSGP